MVERLSCSQIGPNSDQTFCTGTPAPPFRFPLLLNPQRRLSGGAERVPTKTRVCRSPRVPTEARADGGGGATATDQRAAPAWYSGPNPCLGPWGRPPAKGGLTWAAASQLCPQKTGGLGGGIRRLVRPWLDCEVDDRLSCPQIGPNSDQTFCRGTPAPLFHFPHLLNPCLARLLSG